MLTEKTIEKLRAGDHIWLCDDSFGTARIEEFIITDLTKKTIKANSINGGTKYTFNSMHYDSLFTSYKRARHGQIQILHRLRRKAKQRFDNLNAQIKQLEQENGE